MSTRTRLVGCFRAAGIALILLLATLAGTTDSAQAATDRLLGAQTHGLRPGSSVVDAHRELAELQASGAKVVRVDLSWSSLEFAGKGQYSTSLVERTDAYVRTAEQYGLRVVVTLLSTPCWASSAPESLKQGCTGAWWERGVTRYPPTRAEHYADAAVWVARRWGRRITALEIWNEPNLDRFLIAPDQATAYTALLRASYRRVKKAAPNVTVVAGALATSDGEFLKRMYAAGARKNYDALSIHPYNEARDPDDPWKLQWRQYTFLTGVPWVREIMIANGDTVPLWLSEVGFSTCTGGVEVRCVSEPQQAEYINDTFRIASGWSYVGAVIAYELRDSGVDAADREHHFGLLRRDFTRKPAMDAFTKAMAGNFTGL